MVNTAKSRRAQRKRHVQARAQRAYCWRDPERRRAAGRAYYWRNRERILAKHRETRPVRPRKPPLTPSEIYWGNRDKIRFRQKATYLKRREQRLAYQRAYDRAHKAERCAYYLRNREELIERSKRYYRKHREERLAYERKRRQKKQLIA
jgi:hypothetical protein